MLIVIIPHWPQFVSLWGLGAEAPRFQIALKPDPLPWSHVATFLCAVVLFELLPYPEELVRGWRCRKQSGIAGAGGVSAPQSDKPSR
jgi:hypothetical protein